MTHTSTEKPELPEALRLAEMLTSGSAMIPEIDLPEAAAELRRLHARVQELEAERDEAARRAPAVQDANECRVTLITQIHELADHIERAASCVPDSDMRKQMLGQREFALKVSSKWNKNGNQFAAAPQPPEADMGIPISVAAPVRLPEPVGCTTKPRGVAWNTSQIEAGTKLYTEQQVRQILAAHSIKEQST